MLGDYSRECGVGPRRVEATRPPVHGPPSPRHGSLETGQGVGDQPRPWPLRSRTRWRSAGGTSCESTAASKRAA